MATKSINDLREALFETLQAVKSGEMEIERAKTVAEIGQTIINTAKVEIDYIKATDADFQSGFLSATQVSGNQPQITIGATPVVTRVHRLK